MLLLVNSSTASFLPRLVDVQHDLTVLFEKLYYRKFGFKSLFACYLHIAANAVMLNGHRTLHVEDMIRGRLIPALIFRYVQVFYILKTAQVKHYH